MELLSTLIAIPSESNYEDEIKQYILTWLNERSITTFEQDNNVIAFIPGENRETALVFNGHTDTVPAGDLDKWKYGPYTPEIVDELLYGLGSSDMKAGIAGLMELAAYYQEHTPPCDIWFSFVAREETDGRGTESFLEWFRSEGHLDQYVHIEGIIAEPTNCDFIGLGHRGNYFIRLTLPTAAPESVATLETLANDLLPVATKWQSEYRHPMLGAPTLGLTGINYEKTNDDAIATLTLDIRTTPEFHTALDTELTKFLQAYSPTASYEIISSCPVGWCPDDAVLRKIISEDFPELSQQVMTGSTDLCFFSEQGIPCIIFGPGQRERMHSIDETFKCSKLDEFKDTIKKVVEFYGQQ